MPLRNLPGDTVGIAEDQIFADAQRVGSSPTWTPDGRMRERKVTDQAGRTWTEFAAPSSLSWMAGFMGTKRRVASVRHPVSDRQIYPEPKWGPRR